jgi:hypothetical protein
LEFLFLAAINPSESDALIDTVVREIGNYLLSIV